MGELPWDERLIYPQDAEPWHDLGTPFTTTLTGREALELSRCDYGVKLVPAVFYGWEDGELLEQPGKADIIRQPTADDPITRRLSKGSVKSDYTLLPNTELVAMFEPIYEKFPIETMGALFYGRDFFFTLRAGTFRVRWTDPVKQYLAFWLRHDGNAALRISLTGIRQECENTVVAGWNAASARVSINHSRGMKSELEHRRDMIATIQRTQKTQGKEFDEMAAAVLEPWQFEEILLAAFPDRERGLTVPEKVLEFEEYEDGADAPEFLTGPAKAYENQEANNAEIRAYALETLLPKFNDENPQFARTAWAGYNLVTFLLSHMSARIPKTASGETRGRPAQSLIFGPKNRQMAKAYQAALKQAHHPASTLPGAVGFVEE